MASRAGYREPGLGEDELWSTLESPDAPATLRAAAARILARVAPEKGARIARTLGMEHDRATRSRIRVALEEDVDVAASELDGWAAPERGTRHRVSRSTTPGATARATTGSPCAASSASHAASAAAIVVKYGMFASSVCRRSE